MLHHLEFDGFKGYVTSVYIVRACTENNISFHSEGSIVSTIFGLLFWDILFSSIPGAFETPYQSAPLDIATECFLFARRHAIEERLREIENGKAPEILSQTDDKFRENNTMCVGVRWNEFSKQDLVEIVTVSQALCRSSLLNLTTAIYSVSAVKVFLLFAACSARIMEADTVAYRILLYGVQKMELLNS